MDTSSPVSPNAWDERVSRLFIDYGRYFVPERERQIEIIASLLPSLDRPYTVMELCCGEGLLAEALLERSPTCTVRGLDGSPEMLQRAQTRLVRFGERFLGELFDLTDDAWRVINKPVQAVVTSLALHHLDGPRKSALFNDVHRMLAPEGAFIVADIVEPTHSVGWELAAREWDEAVQERCRKLDGNNHAYEYFDREHWNIYRYFDPQDIDKPSPLFSQLKWLEQAGFVAVDVFWMRAGHAIFGGWRSDTVGGGS